MSQRFFFQSDAESPLRPGDTVTLDSVESHHLLHVMRAKVGQAIQLFDGSGHEFDSEIVAMGRKEVQARVLTRQEIDREPANRLTLIVPLPKGDRQKFLIEKLTEIGVYQVVFLETQRSSVVSSPNSMRKLERQVIEASKQCGRNRLMRICGPIKLTDLTESPSSSWQSRYLDLEDSQSADLFFGHPSGEQSLADYHLSGDHQVVMIGPEGGFSVEEVESLLAAEWLPAQLGRSILRMETAAMVAAAVLSQRQA